MSIDKVRGTDTLTLRLTKEDRAALDELVEAARVELEPRGVVVSAALYVRGLIRTAHSGMASGAPATVPAPNEAEVRQKLKASKRTQAELARATGIDAAMLSRFRSGKKSLSPEKLARLSDALG
jgi:transposase-like protein